MAVVINIRGTNGSGKSTVVRRVMAHYPDRRPIMVEGRRRPLGYHLRGPAGSLFVPGHYEIACGGCDTLKTPGQVYDMIQEALASSPGIGVVYEGLMVQDDVRRAVELDKALRPDRLHVILLSTPIEECLAAVRGRREERGDTRPLPEKNTRTRARSQENIRGRLRDAGVEVERLDRGAAYMRCCALLSLQPSRQSADEAHTAGDEQPAEPGA